MARYLGPKCKLSRREGVDLHLKSAARALESKCNMERAPGQHGARRARLSGYGLQLREKQKLRRIYGLLERQFRNYYEKALRIKGITGENLLRLLERRLDNVVYRLGFAPSRNAARQLVRHRHFMVNNRPVDIPSFSLRPGDVVKVREKSRKLELIHASMRKMKEGRLLPWLELDKANLAGTVLEIPGRADIPTEANENLVVELYSK